MFVLVHLPDEEHRSDGLHLHLSSALLRPFQSLHKVNKYKTFHAILKAAQKMCLKIVGKIKQQKQKYNK